MSGERRRALILGILQIIILYQLDQVTIKILLKYWNLQGFIKQVIYDQAIIKGSDLNQKIFFNIYINCLTQQYEVVQQIQINKYYIKIIHRKHKTSMPYHSRLQYLILALTATIIISPLYIANINIAKNKDNHQTTQLLLSSSQLFQQWMTKYAKQYNKIGEKQYRRAVWVDNLQFVTLHNMKYQEGVKSYQVQMNQFADLTNQQFAQIYTMKVHNLKQQLKTTNKCNGQQPPQSQFDLPQAIDWAAKGAVTTVKDQGQCGSCWAFSTTGSLEGLNYKKNGNLTSFSQQQLMDCSHTYGNMGCNGGYMQNSMFYVIDHGITTESKYPYKQQQTTCHYNPQDKAFQITDCTLVTPLKQKSLQAAIAQGPTSVAIQANHLSFQLYKSGIYNGNCGTKLDHGVLAVGYGALDGKNYYKVKNSWGGRWGMQGYIYIIRNGDGKGKCGIQMEPVLPL